MTDLWVNRVSGKVKNAKSRIQTNMSEKDGDMGDFSNPRTSTLTEMNKIPHKSSKETINSETYSVTRFSHRLKRMQDNLGPP